MCACVDDDNIMLCETWYIVIVIVIITIVVMTATMR